MTEATITEEAGGFVAACPHCDWKSEPQPFKGSAHLRYYDHLDESSVCAEVNA